MGVWKRPEQVLAEIETREQVYGLVEPKHRAAAKYKKDAYHAKQKHIPDRPTLRVGSRLIFPIRSYREKGPSSIAAYGLGIVLDWVNNRWRTNEGTEQELVWDGNAQVIVQVTKVSNPSYAAMVGHLRVIDISSWEHCYSSHAAKFTPEEVKQADYGL